MTAACLTGDRAGFDTDAGLYLVGSPNYLAQRPPDL